MNDKGNKMETSIAILTFNYMTGVIEEYDPAGSFLQRIECIPIKGEVSCFKRAHKMFNSIWREWYSDLGLGIENE